MDKDTVNKLMEQKVAQSDESECRNQWNPISRPHRKSAEERTSWDLRALETDEKGKINIAKFSAGIAFLSSNNRCCKTALNELKSIKLGEMKVPLIHFGKYLICKSLGKPFPVAGFMKASERATAVFAGINCLIEDLNGDVEEVFMYNFLQPFNNLDWISPGAIFIIKEPWLRYGSQGKIPSIQIFSPSDVIFIDPNDEGYLSKIGANKWFIEMSENAEVWREKANECFKKREYDMALMLYDRGIRCNPELPVLYLNKSLTCLRTNAYFMAYETAKIALNKNGDREKALYRMGQAAYGMREWQKAAQHFIEILKEFPEHQFASEQFKRTTTRLAEHKHAKFDFKSMHLESKKDKPNLDIADYIGPIEIANIPGKGRGIIASKDIKEGTLLAVSKAFATGYDKDFPSDFFKMHTNGGTHMLQEMETMKALQKNPQRAKEIYDLDAGDMPHEEIPSGVIDAERIGKICTINRFGSRNDANDNEVSHCSLFILPSYFNHSCLANAYRTFYGDVMVIHAIDDIKKGHEIYLSYLNPLKGFLDRKNILSDWKFTCHCKLCKTDAADPYCLKRNQMFQEFRQLSKDYSPQDIIAKGEPLLKKIRESYVDRKELQVVLAQMLNILTGAYFDLQNTSKVIQCLEEIIILMDNPLKYDMELANIQANLAICYAESRNFAKCGDMVDKAKELSFCVDFEHFQMLFPQFSLDSHKCQNHKML